MSTGIEVFQVQSYKAYNADLSNLSDNAAKIHWLKHGIDEGRRASASFSTQAYYQRYPPLAAALGGSYSQGIYHYILHGISEGRLGQ